MNIELLAPAGSYQTVEAAIQAGADAVYMGGMKFGARAFAENGDEDTVIAAIRYVHLHGKKLYLTVNTLLKNRELEQELYAYLKPLYEAGLDAVIVQDPGVLRFVKEHFPDMHIHASTQMTITGEMSAALLEEMGCNRIVTARELSLKEIEAIRDRSSLEIESFIHGALCYCYSGQCLMSSLFGGRSGNRGRCAQPCRLPYGVYENGKKINSEKNQFALSPKDMCTIEILPEILRAGVTSLKIEGRMKRPEYTAGVVRIYRKYLDLYLENAEFYTKYPERYHVEKADLQELFDLYNRDGFHTGYYRDHNGPKMMAVKNEKLSNGQKARNEALFGHIKAEYLDKQKKIPLDGFLELRVGQPARFVVRNAGNVKKTMTENASRKVNNSTVDNDIKTINAPTSVVEENNNKFSEEADTGFCVEVTGQVVDMAQKQPLSKERILSQMKKTGNTPFEFVQLDVEMDENLFMPMQALNELRRAGLEAYENSIYDSYVRQVPQEETQIATSKIGKFGNETCSKQKKQLQDSEFAKELLQNSDDQKAELQNAVSDAEVSETENCEICVSVETKEQLKIALTSKQVARIYASVTVFDKKDLVNSVADYIQDANRNGKKAYIALPFIVRKDALSFLEKYYQKFIDMGLAGYLVRSLESVSHLRALGLASYLVADANLYTYNNRAKEYYGELGICRDTAPYELNSKELRGRENCNSEVVIYGYQPLMVSVQCVKKNFRNCTKKSEILTLQDRYKKEFCVKCVCDFCYNIIYNSIPLGIWKEAEELKQLGFTSFRMNFTMEQPEEMKKLLNDFGRLYLYRDPVSFGTEQFTKGHLKRGVE